MKRLLALLLLLTALCADVPHQLHFFWLEEGAFPRHSVENLRSWQALHPGWKVILWSDRDHECPCLGVEMRRVPLSVGECERALVPYRVLEQEGGVIVDHHEEALSSLAPLAAPHDLFAASPHLLGARAHHPFVMQFLHEVVAGWASAPLLYPGQDEEALRFHHLLRMEAPLKNLLEQAVLLPAGVMKRRSLHQHIPVPLPQETLKRLPHLLRGDLFLLCGTALLLCLQTLSLFLLSRKLKKSSFS